MPQLPAPKFPSFSELVGAIESAPPETKRSGLFLDLVGDPQVLYQDLLEDPNRYEEGVSNLLQDLTSGQRSIDELSKTEMHLLDRAVLDFNQPKRPRPEPKLAPVPKTKKSRVKLPDEKPPKVIGAPRDMEPYWWLK